jgi:hypothetical protein
MRSDDAGASAASRVAPARGAGRAASRPWPNVVTERVGTRLLHQQCWHWGWDIRHGAGNLLLDHGFSRYRVEAEKGSAYTLRREHGVTVTLWGFGMFYGVDGLGGLYLQRYGFAPRLLTADPPPTAIRLHDLPARRAPTTEDDWRVVGQLAPDAFRWIAAYERWVLETHGLAYRRAAIRARPRLELRRAVPPARVPTVWENLADGCVAALRGEGRSVARTTA